MSKTSLLRQVSVLVVALAATVTATSYAQQTASAKSAKKPAPAQTGVILPGGSQSSGGTVNYNFVLTNTVNGTLQVKASIKLGKWKPKFPDLNSSTSAGANVITGPTLTIPSNVQGTGSMKVQVKFNKKKITKRTITVVIGPPIPSSSSSVSTNLLDVGFENSVTLDSSIVPTGDLGDAPTYAWTQTSGKPVVLSANNVAAPTFTTDALTNFVTMGTAMYFNDIDEEDGTTNQVYVTREDRFATNNCNSIALDAEQAGAATYGFKVLVSNGSVTRTGVFTVACSIQTPAQPNIPLGVTAYFRGNTNSMNWTLVNRPGGSTASLNHTNGLIAELRPDVEGPYVIRDNVTGKSVTNVCASFTGYQFCAICHGPGNNVNLQDKVSLWKETHHASFFQRAIDGQESSHYSGACITCHTVGNNPALMAVNAGFDDVAKDLGWTFPSVLRPGNFAAMPDALKAKANIQCESCHGPGSQHPGSPSVSTDVRVCGQCHQDGDRHFRPQQWEISPHSGGYENIATSRGTNPQCARCHSPVGYLSVARGYSNQNGVHVPANVSTTNSVPTGVGALTCQACHDPHDKFDNEERHQLRVYDTALLGNPYFRSNDVTIALGESITTADPRLTNSNLKVTGLGNSATCIACHNGRQLPTQVQTYGTTKGQMFYQVGGPHDQTAGEAFLGVGMYDYGQVMGNSFHTYLASCQQCHMYQLRAPVNGIPQDSISIDDVETPVTQGVYDQYANLLGNHTFKMNYESGGSEVDNIAACNQCHANFEKVTTFDFKSVYAKDYDGNGVVEGVQTETKGVLANLAYLLMYGNGGTNGIWATTNATGEVSVPLTLVTNKVAGVTNSVVAATGMSFVTSFSSAAGFYSTNAPVADAQRKAVWNWLAAYREGSWGVHNTQYIIRLLQTTYTDLSTNYYGDVSKTYQNAFPSAYLR